MKITHKGNPYIVLERSGDLVVARPEGESAIAFLFLKLRDGSYYTPSSYFARRYCSAFSTFTLERRAKDLLEDASTEILQI